jgi:hypothetical protein
MCLSGRGLLVGSYLLSGRVLVVGRHVCFRNGFGVRHLGALRLGSGRQVCAFLVGGWL